MIYNNPEILLLLKKVSFMFTYILMVTDCGKSPLILTLTVTVSAFYFTADQTAQYAP